MAEWRGVCGVCIRRLFVSDDKMHITEQFLFIDCIDWRISGELLVQHVGCTENDCCCCVDMKRIRAPVHREARFNIRGCANQLNNNSNNNDNDVDTNNGHVIRQMKISRQNRSRRHQPRCSPIFREQSTAMQQSVWPAKAVSARILHVLSLSALYLVVAANARISGASAAAVATAATTTVAATFDTTNNLPTNNSQRFGAVYAALSGAHANVPTTIDPGEYNLYHEHRMEMLSYARNQPHTRLCAFMLNALNCSHLINLLNSSPCFRIAQCI